MPDRPNVWHTVDKSIRMTRSARKHRLGAAHVWAAMMDAGVPTALTGGKLLYVGVDDRGIELEVIAVPDNKHPGGLAVIHAMPTSYRSRPVGGRE